MTPKMPIFLLLTLIAMLGSAVPIAADSAYKWVDEEGVTHYSQRLPPDQESKKMAPPPPAPDKPKTPSESLKARLERLEREQAAREKAAKQQTQEQEQHATRKRNCEAARKNLQLYEGNPHWRIGDNSGNYTRLSDEERHARITEAKQQIEANCN